MLPNVSHYIKRPRSEKSSGSEFYGFPFWFVDVQDLWDSGWVDSRTWAIFHDFTMYAKTKDEFCNVRLLYEVDINSGYVETSMNLRVVNLHDFISNDLMMIVEICFVCLLMMLIAAEVIEFRDAFNNATAILSAELVEMKYRYRYRVQLHRAAHGSKRFDPMNLLRKLSVRLYKSDHLNSHYIVALNDIGRDTVDLQAVFNDAVSTHALTGGHNAEAPFPAHKKWKAELTKKRKEIARSQENVPGATMLQVFHDFIASFRAAKRFYFGNHWNYIDVINYMIFLLAVYLRLSIYWAAPGVKEKVASLEITGPNETFLNMYFVAASMGVGHYIIAFNAVLTWVKLFKFLAFHPTIKVFNRTLSVASSTLSIFFFLFTIVVIGSAHGFMMAFGGDIEDFKSLPHATMTTLRMAVGDFDYDSMYLSQRFLGPVLFWVFIFLVYFVLISMFIALLSEAYMKARQITPFCLARAFVCTREQTNLKSPWRIIWRVRFCWCCLQAKSEAPPMSQFIWEAVKSEGDPLEAVKANCLVKLLSAPFGGTKDNVKSLDSIGIAAQSSSSKRKLSSNSSPSFFSSPERKLSSNSSISAHSKVGVPISGQRWSSSKLEFVDDSSSDDDEHSDVEDETPHAMFSRRKGLSKSKPAKSKRKKEKLSNPADTDLRRLKGELSQVCHSLSNTSWSPVIYLKKTK